MNRGTANSLGYAEIRRLQDTAVRAFVAGSDLFVSIPKDGRAILACSTCLGATIHRSPVTLGNINYDVTSRANEIPLHVTRRSLSSGPARLGSATLGLNDATLLVVL